MVVIVMPPFPQRDQSEEKTVPALVPCLKTAPTEEVAGGINQKSGVPQNGRANKKSPEQAGPSAHGKAQDPPDDGRDQKEFIEPSEFRVAGKVWDGFKVCFVIFRIQNPSHMGIPNPLLHGRMKVLWSIGILVVGPMMAGPP